MHIAVTGETVNHPGAGALWVAVGCNLVAVLDALPFVFFAMLFASRYRVAVM
jgi:hypothetical protein